MEDAGFENQIIPVFCFCFDNCFFQAQTLKVPRKDHACVSTRFVFEIDRYLKLSIVFFNIYNWFVSSKYSHNRRTF